MKRTLLKFSSAIYLIAFRKFSKATDWEINLNNLTVVCNCSDKEVILACKDFKAVLVTSEDELEVSILNRTGDLSILHSSHSIAS